MRSKTNDQQLIWRNAMIVSLLPIDESLEAIHRGEWGTAEETREIRRIVLALLEVKRLVEVAAKKGMVL